MSCLGTDGQCSSATKVFGRLTHHNIPLIPPQSPPRRWRSAGALDPSGSKVEREIPLHQLDGRYHTFLTSVEELESLLLRGLYRQI